MFLISCLIVALGQPSSVPWLGPIAAAIGYALFWRFLPQKGRFWRAMLWYTLVSLAQLSWMSSIEYQGFYILLVWLGLSLGIGAQFGLLTLTIPRSGALQLRRMLAIASFWTLMEWSRFFFLCGYSWNLSALSLSNPYSIQLASLFGVLGLSFWVIFSNLLGLKALNEKKMAPAMVWLGAVCFPLLFGLGHLAFHQHQMEKMGEKPFSSLLVQTGLLPSEKTMLGSHPQDYISSYHQWSRILNLLKEGHHPVDLIVLPEAVVPYIAYENVYKKEIVDLLFTEILGPEVVDAFPAGQSEAVSNMYWIQTLSNFFKCELIAGLDHQDSDGRYYSSVFYTKPKSNSQLRYDKRILVPMAEYLPFRFLLPLVETYGISTFFEQGQEAKVFEGKVPMSIAICYEETFPQNVREGRLKGGKMLINVTNDGWYPFSSLPSQQYEHARLRAVENGIPLLRACNTGVTAAIDSLGRTIGEMGECIDGKKLQAGVLHTEISTYEYPTLFKIWGNGGILTLCAIFIGVFLISKRKISCEDEFAVAKNC